MPAKFVRELVVRYRRCGLKRFAIETVTCGRDVYRACRHLAQFPRENLIVLLLDNANRVVGYETVSIGTHQASLAEASCVFQSALLCGATSLILVHNHPSGHHQPSKEDRAITSRLRAVGELVGIKLLYHVVIGESGFHSFADAGEL